MTMAIIIVSLLPLSRYIIHQSNKLTYPATNFSILTFLPSQLRSIMQEAIPYKSWLPTPSTIQLIGESSAAATPQRDDVRDLISENAAIVLGLRGCCLSHVVKRLLLGLGANPAAYEIDAEAEKDVIAELGRLAGGGISPVQLPVVFIGGRLFGGLDRIMATHITGELIPVLKQAGALWL